VKFVVDMNLSRAWVAYLEGGGHEAAHWSDIGRVDAADDEIMCWAGENESVILTRDLDFGAMLATAGLRRPSVVQLRTDSALPERIGGLVLRVIQAQQAALKSGALLTIDGGRSRLRIVPLASLPDETS